MEPNKLNTTITPLNKPSSEIIEPSSNLEERNNSLEEEMFFQKQNKVINNQKRFYKPELSNQEIASKDFYKEKYQPFQEKTVIRYRDKPKRLFGLGIGCRGLGCGCLLLILLLLISIIYLFTTKPKALWEVAVNFLNDNIVLEQNNSKQDPQDVKSNINNQIKSVGDTDIIITQEQLSSLAKDKFTNFKNLTSVITKDYIRLYWDLDQSIPSLPLKGIIELKLDSNNKLYLSKLGTGRIGFPHLLNNFMTNTFYSILNINNSNKDDKYGFLLNLLPATNMKIKSLELNNGQLHIKANIKVDLFSN